MVYIVPAGFASSRRNLYLALAGACLQERLLSRLPQQRVQLREFMEHASTAAMPGYLLWVDGSASDMHVALTEINRRLLCALSRSPGSKSALMGYSMGAFHSLFIASTEPTNQLPLIKFDRYVAVNTPVGLLHGIGKLDEFYRAPLDWPVAERTDDIENTFLKVAALSKLTLAPRGPLPFNAVESRFLIGLSFRFILRDIIFSSQRRNNQGVLLHPVRNLRRNPLYQEILQYSYQDYFQKFVIPYYWSRGIDSPVADALAKAGDLRTYDAGLRANPKIRVIVNQNDFLLTDEDLAWLRATFTTNQLTVFAQGGHLGNLTNPKVQEAILGALQGLKPAKQKFE